MEPATCGEQAPWGSEIGVFPGARRAAGLGVALCQVLDTGHRCRVGGSGQTPLAAV